MIPPMTTVASGRCTSAPVPVLSAIGKKPGAANGGSGRSICGEDAARDHGRCRRQGKE